MEARDQRYSPLGRELLSVLQTAVLAAPEKAAFASVLQVASITRPGALLQPDKPASVVCVRLLRAVTHHFTHCAASGEPLGRQRCEHCAPQRGLQSL